MSDNLRYLNQLTKASQYIEKNLSGKIDIELLARHCGMSEGNFWRVFKKHLGESVGSYIRKRRLTVAARMLVSKKTGIDYVCDKLGFDSPEVFYRSFKKQFGITPAQYRGIDGEYYMYERKKMTREYIKHMLTGGVSLKPKIAAKKKVILYGFKEEIKRSESIMRSAVFFTSFTMKRIIARCSNRNRYYVCVSGINNKKLFRPEDRLDVFAGSTEKCLKENVKRKIVSGGRYAVFTHKGPVNNAAHSCEYIFSRWASRKKNKPERIIAAFDGINYLSGNFIMELMIPL